MKVCKKCKKHVANKTKICKYCGTDVSKAKIIKNKPKINNQKSKKDTIIKKEKTIKIPEEINYSPCKEKVNTKKIEKNDKNNTKPSKNQKNHFSKPEKKSKKRKLNLFIEKIKTSLVNLKKYFSNNKLLNNKFSYRILMLVIILIIALGIGSYFAVNTYKDYTNSENTVVVGEKATTEKIFGMGDLITYNGIDYKVVKVETSEGNSYKAPKEGNQFLIVTVYMKNNTSDKVEYSYKNWTMSNSKGEEEKRIFTSVNVDTALYSGDLVIGGIKTGSMVFEQPIKDPKLRMNFYELKKDENGEEIIDHNKKIFSVSVKIPEKENENNEENKKTLKNDGSNTEVVKTIDKKQN